MQDIERLYPYVKYIANKYSKYGVPVKDLEQEGVLGIYKAKLKFNRRKKTKFVAYATWWIKQSILDAISKNKLVHHPSGKINLFREIRRVRDVYTTTFHREPSNEEIIKELQLDEENYVNTVQSALPIVSINVQIDDEEKSTFEDLLSSEDVFGHQVERNDLKISINQALKKVTPREKIIVENFFGLNGKPKIGLEEIGENLKLTRERCRQLKNEALKKMEDTIKENYFA